MFKQIDKCRICANPRLAEILNLGSQALTGVFPKSKVQVVEAGPLELVKCVDGCGLVQLRHSFPPDQMYGDNYGYRSGLNASMVKHLQGRVLKAIDRVSLAPGDIVLDIGSNDATTLRSYGSHGYRLVGMDPSGGKFRQYYPEWVELLPEFFSSDSFHRCVGPNSAKIITSIAMFYDLEDPIDFMRQVCSSLDDEGIWIFEQSYLPLMIERNAYDTVCHEHVSYYALRQIKWMADRAGLKILDVELNDINGGSFCVTCAKSGSKHAINAPAIERLLSCEENEGFNGLDVYAKFRERVFNHRDELRSLLRRLSKSGKRVYGYGASTKGNVILQFCGISTQEMPSIAEVNQEKFGAFTPHTRIPIASENEVKMAGAEYLVVFPWHFRDNILQRERAFLEGGGNLIFPLPTLEIVHGRAARRKAA